jgi:c-di-GMP-related signal transduction protein
MDAFVARQPIFDARRDVVAYELLFRSGTEDFFGGLGPDGATRKLIADASMVFGFEDLTRGRDAYVNATREVLLGEAVGALPPESVVLEILEDVEVDGEVIDACRRLRHRGYRIALDDVTDVEQLGPALDVTDIVKLDFRATPLEDRPAIAEAARRAGARLLAEKVETHAELERARELGCELFQGYYYCRPVLVEVQDAPAFEPHVLELLQELHKPSMNFDRVERLVRADVGLAVKLLRFINSAQLSLRTSVTSVRQALTMLGERGFRRWATLLVLTHLGQEKPRELLTVATTRGRFEELVAPGAGLRDRGEELFLMGLFSVVDALVDRPLDRILVDLPLAEDVKAGLLGEENAVRRVHACTLDLEAGAWDALSDRSRGMGLAPDRLPGLWAEAMLWSSRMLDG